MDIGNFNNALLLSNKNVEKLARKYINESCNAVLMEMFEDKCILADHTTGQIFEAEYSFDGETFEFKNFEEIELEENNTSLKEAISDYFDDKNINLTEAYESAVGSVSDEFESSLSEALASKNMEGIVDYSSLSGINEEIGELKENATFKAYSERLEKKPAGSIKYFNWKSPVKVSVLDEDDNVILNKSIFTKAKKLRTNTEFKKNLAEAAAVSLNGDSTILEELIAENDSIVALSESELQELIGMSLIGNKKLMDSRKEIVEKIENFIGEDVGLSEKRAIVEAEKADDSEENTEDSAPEASEQDVEAIKKALEKAKEKATDEKLVSKIDSIINSLTEAVEDEATDVAAIKEAVILLNM
jgi:hypothetical protein